VDKRALVIGSQTYGLQGVLADAKRMGKALERFGFSCNHCVGDDATRDGILNAYRKLISETQANDAAVIYYSGHGGLVRNGDFEQSNLAMGKVPLPRHVQFIVPVDYAPDSKEFRGITSYELSDLLAELTKKTNNVTVILDCCHSAHISRNLQAIPKSLRKPKYMTAPMLLAELKNRNVDISRDNLYSNLNAVRLVGCGELQSAFEILKGLDEYGGALTDALLSCLAELPADSNMTWRHIADRVRENVLALISMQRPEVEGPAERRIFGVEVPVQEASVAIAIVDAEVTLRIGKLMGVRQRDEFFIMPMGAQGALREKAIAKAIVNKVKAIDSTVDVLYFDGHNEIPDGARAFPVSCSGIRQRVFVKAGDDEIRSTVRATLRQSPVLEVVNESSERDFAVIHIENDELHVHFPGQATNPPAKYSTYNILQVRKNLHSAALAKSFRELTSAPGDTFQEGDLELEVGRVANGAGVPLKDPNEELGLEAQIYIRAYNRNPHKEMYVSFLNIGVDDAVSLIAGSIRLGPNQEYIIPRGTDGKLKGLDLFWPQQWPKDRPREDQVIAIATETDVNLQWIKTPGQVPLQPRAMHSPTLAFIIDQIGGKSRNIGSADGPEDGYLVKRVQFILHPQPISYDSGFLVDDRPAMSMFALSPKGGKRKTKIAIRLKEVVIKYNHALWGATDIRVDTFVATRGKSKPYQVETVTFPKVNDGAVLPIGKLLVYHGEVSDFVDFAVWVSRDRNGSPTLAQLIETQFKAPDLQGHLMKLAEVVSITPQAGTVIAAASAALGIAQIVQSVLGEVAGKTIGMYRTSFLAAERFGVDIDGTVGRHEIEGRDFSMIVEVVDVGED